MQEDKYSNLTDEELRKRVYYLDMKNRQLEGRVAQLEPYKQRQIKNPPKQKHDQLFDKFQIAKYALKIMYIGTNYNGVEHQEQTNNTIEQFLFKCLFGLSLIKDRQPDKQYTRAARTDKGVSAYGNVLGINLRTNILKEPKGTRITQKQNDQIIKQKQDLNYVKMINSILPEDIRILACKKVDQSFNARYSCYQRSYKYFFPRNYYNIEIMSEAIKKFQGKHNFINFCKLDITNTIDFEKTMIKARIQKCQRSILGLNKDERNEIYYFHFVANSFLWHQIRYMSTILFLIGMGRQKPDIIDEMLNITLTKNKPNYPAAPQYPLILETCEFKDLSFQMTKDQSVNISNTLNTIIMSRIMQMTLYVNCLSVMKTWGLKSIGMNENEIIKQAIEDNKWNQISRNKKIQFSKPTGIAYNDKQQSLKGKQKQLHEKKVEKRKKYVENTISMNGDEKLQ